MRRAERQAVGEALGELVARVDELVAGVQAGIAARVFRAVPGSRPVAVAHDVTSRAVHAAVGRGGRALLRGAGRAAAALPEGDRSWSDQPGGATTRAIVNGVVGDLLVEQDNALAITMGLRHGRRDLPTTRDALADAYPDATSRVAVHVHGLTEDETAFTWGSARHGVPPRHEALLDELGLTPVFVRYNSGLRIADNGLDLAALLAELDRTWPVPIGEIVLVGHSMGALVAESALVLAHEVGERWAGRTSHVVALAAPHHGAGLERRVNVLTSWLRRWPETGSVGRFLDTRSVGIKDLRFGAVDESWRGHDPDEVLVDRRGPTELPDHVRLHVVGATLSGDPTDARSRLLGDLLVTPDSARGHRDVGWRLEPHTTQLLTRTHHFDVMNHPDVTAHLRRVLATPVTTPR